MNAQTNTAPALILVDIQYGLDQLDYYGGERNNPDAEANAGKILHRWRQLGWPIIHIKHDSTTPGSPLTKGLPGNTVKAVVQPLPTEPLLSKNVNSAFIGTDLEARLRAQNITTVLIVGLTTQHCISTTVRMAANLGFTTYLASDATAAFAAKGLDGNTFPADLVHQIALSELNNEFATVLPTAEILTWQ